MARPGILKWVGLCKGRGSTKTGGLGDGRAGSRGRAPVGGLGDEVPQKLKGFCNLCLKFVTFCDNNKFYTPSSACTC